MLGAVDLVLPAAAPQLFESGTVDMREDDPARIVVSAIGSYSCCDVWLSRPLETSASYRLRMFGRVGDARVLLAELPADELTYTTDDSREGAIAFSIRGRPSSAFEVELAPDSGDVSGIQVFLQAWHADIPIQTTPNPQRGQVGRAAYPTFSAASDRPITAPTSLTAGGTVSLATLWHPSGNTKRIELRRVVVTYFGVDAGGSIRLRGARLTGGTAPSGEPPVDPVAHDLSDEPASPAAEFLVNPTSVSGRSSTDFFMAMLKPSQGRFEWSAAEDGKPIVLRASRDEGFEVRAHIEVQIVTSGMTFGVYFQWIEI